MLGDLSRVEKIYLRTGYTDMRKQLDGLVDIIQYSFQLDPYSNSLFLFCGKRADRIKQSIMKGTASACSISATKRPPPMAADGRRSQTDLPPAAPLAAGGPEPGAAKSGPQLGSPEA